MENGVYMLGVAEDGDKNGTVRQCNAELVDIHGFGSGRESVGRVVAISEEVSETVRVHMAWVGGNVNWERWF